MKYFQVILLLLFVSVISAKKDEQDDKDVQSMDPKLKTALNYLAAVIKRSVKEGTRVELEILQIGDFVRATFEYKMEMPKPKSIVTRILNLFSGWFSVFEASDQ